MQIRSIILGRRTALVRGVAGALLALALTGARTPAPAASLGKLQGKVVATDTGDPIGFADVLLLPADTTQRRVGGLTNADGTFLLEAAPGVYTFRIRALSYATKSIQGVTIEAGRLLPLSTALQPEALVQEEIVVEARLKQNTETSLLSARRKASTVGDAVSAEQVRRSPDKDAADVLRRVTGLSVSDGKFVFVRGLGERYSSTEVDGVRIASPEQNKRVVPLDLLPANLLENVVVQKTYSADRPGEFGGGNVQVKTRDFPGARTWSFSASHSFDEGTTFEDFRTYRSSRADVFGFGASSRAFPGAVSDAAGNRPLTTADFNQATLAGFGRSFDNVWTPNGMKALPNGSYHATYGDEFKVFGRPLGVVQSLSMSRSFNRQEESQRFFQESGDTTYDYAVDRSNETVQLGGMAAMSYRLSPRHTLHMRGLYTRTAEDEVRSYQGIDHNRVDFTGAPLERRATRLMYVERSVLNTSIEGRHEFARLFGSQIDWKVSRSDAKRLQPDRRETAYEFNGYDDGSGTLVTYYSLTEARREFGDLDDQGVGLDASWGVPYRLGRLGNGKVRVGFSRQTKDRSNAYRRLTFNRGRLADPTAPPESLFQESQFDGSRDGAWIEEASGFNKDNYQAEQRVTAGFVSLDVPLGSRVRGTFGVRVEDGFQDVRTFSIFDPSLITDRGTLANTDWLPSGNLTVQVVEALQIRLAASRTLSRPDLNELSPFPALDYIGGYQVSGNPDLERFSIDNYDVRVEVFPSLSEVFAAGFFYKRLRHPIERTFIGGSPPILSPINADQGRNLGIELEARASLERAWKGLRGLSINSNLSIISSEVRMPERYQGSGASEHPLQGQANYLANAALSYTTPSGRTDVSLLMSSTGKRLETLGISPLPDIYEQPITTLDAAINVTALQRLRVKLAAKNLADARSRHLQAGKEVSGYRSGRSYSVGFSFGS